MASITIRSDPNTMPSHSPRLSRQNAVTGEPPSDLEMAMDALRQAQEYNYSVTISYEAAPAAGPTPTPATLIATPEQQAILDVMPPQSLRAEAGTYEGLTTIPPEIPEPSAVRSVLRYFEDYLNFLYNQIATVSEELETTRRR